MTNIQSRAIVAHINSKLNLLEILRGYGFNPVAETSGRHKMCCPLHNERTPSFVIYPNNSYYCFGCASGGKIVNFIMSYEKKSLDDVVGMFSDQTDISSDKFYIDSIVRNVEKKTFDLEKHKNNMKYQLGIFLRDVLYKDSPKKNIIMQCFKEMDWFFSNESNDDEMIINEFVDSTIERVS